MEFELSWILFGLPLAFALGWLASRFDLHQLRIENRTAPKAYFKGLSYLLNEQQDQAIDAFIEAVQKDPDSSELHFALGNLFRRRGEYERAIRVHEHLLSRADLKASEHDRAQYALAKDFLSAGLMSHAEEALHKLEHGSYREQAWMALLGLHERARDWAKAAEIARRLQDAGRADFTPRLSHYLCEQAADCLRKSQDSTRARQLLEQAIAESPRAPRPYIELAGLLDKAGQYGAAVRQLQKMAQNAPQAIPLIASEWVRISQKTGDLETVAMQLQRIYEQTPSVDIADALARAKIARGEPASQARAVYLRHMEQEPSLIAAIRWLNEETLCDRHCTQVIRQSLENAARPLARYRCAACGFETQGYFWQCPGCQAWESIPPRRMEEM